MTGVRPALPPLASSRGRWVPGRRRVRPPRFPSAFSALGIATWIAALVVVQGVTAAFACILAGNASWFPLLFLLTAAASVAPAILGAGLLRTGRLNLLGRALTGGLVLASIAAGAAVFGLCAAGTGSPVLILAGIGAPGLAVASFGRWLTAGPTAGTTVGERVRQTLLAAGGSGFPAGSLAARVAGPPPLPPGRSLPLLGLTLNFLVVGPVVAFVDDRLRGGLWSVSATFETGLLLAVPFLPHLFLSRRWLAATRLALRHRFGLGALFIMMIAGGMECCLWATRGDVPGLVAVAAVYVVPAGLVLALTWSERILGRERVIPALHAPGRVSEGPTGDAGPARLPPAAGCVPVLTPDRARGVVSPSPIRNSKVETRECPAAGSRPPVPLPRGLPI